MDFIKYRISFLLVIMSAAVILLAIAANQFFLKFMTSDSISLFEMATIFLQNHTFAGENFSAAPYYFPDIFLTTGLEIFTKNITTLNFLYSLVFLSAYLFFVYQILRVSLLDKYLSTLGALIALSIFFFIVSSGMWFIQYWPTSHLSVVLFSLYFIGYYTKNLNSGIPLPTFLLLFVVTYFIFISDNLVVSQLLFPLSVIIIFDLITKKSNKKFGISLLFMFFFVILLGVKIDDFLTKYFDISFSFNVSLFRVRKLSELGSTLQQVTGFFSQSIAANPLFYAILLVYHVFCLVMIFILRKQKNKHTLENTWRIIGFLYLSQISTVVLAILVGKVKELGHFRYLDTLYIFPAVTLSLLMVQCLQRKIAMKFLVILNCVLITSVTYIFFFSSFFSLNFTNFDPPYNNSVQCIDDLQKQYSIKNGVADYWNTRTVRMLSKKGIMISQVDENLELINRVDNKLFFYADTKRKIPLQYQFIIMNNLSREKVEKILGKSDKIVDCAGREVWLYLTKEKRAKLNNYFSTHAIV